MIKNTGEKFYVWARTAPNKSKPACQDIGEKTTSIIVGVPHHPSWQCNTFES
jgi:hypothetical protein